MQGYLKEAIFTKLLPATNFKGARVKAKCSSGEVTLNYNYSRSVEDTHLEAVTALMRKLHFTINPYRVHTAKTREGYVHIIEFIGGWK